jgi:hypothetical protein
MSAGRRRSSLKVMASRAMGRLGFDLVHYKNPDFDQQTLEVIRKIRPYTMTSAESVFALIQAVTYVVRAGIAGSMVECGVWRGGSMMAVAYTLLALGRTDRDLFLFDTYEGMTPPGADDVSRAGERASATFAQLKKDDGSSDWSRASLGDVRRNLLATGYSGDRVKFVKGRVEDTIPGEAPGQIAILRLDTDWYESTRHELVHLYPRLSPGGVLLIDDYGLWLGQKKAVDEYFAPHPILLNRVDSAGRIAVKV